MFLLDTNTCIALLKRNPIVMGHLVQHQPSDIAMCSVVKAELYFGARKSQSVASNLARLEKFFRPYKSHPFDDPASETYGMIRADLERSGTPIGANDLLIASIAKTQDLILVTHNTGEFSRVVGLKLEDWEI
jgi:tRNA(fMet)-specific endonuclease VapC